MPKREEQEAKGINTFEQALQHELKDSIKIVFEEEKKRSAAYDGDVQIGECEYSDSASMWILSHTRVRPAYEGRGIAKKLVQKVIEEARNRKVKILPLCPYAKRMMNGKEEYSDVL